MARWEAVNDGDEGDERLLALAGGLEEGSGRGDDAGAAHGLPGGLGLGDQLSVPRETLTCRDKSG